MWLPAPRPVCLCLSLYFIVRDTPTGDLSPRKCSWGWLGAALERLRCLPWACGRESSAMLGFEPKDPPSLCQASPWSLPSPTRSHPCYSLPALGVFLAYQPVVLRPCRPGIIVCSCSV